VTGPATPSTRTGDVLPKEATPDALARLGARPAISAESRPVWDAAAQGRLIVEQCKNCGLHIFPPRGVCRRCYRREMSWVDVRPPGVLHAFTENHHPWVPGVGIYKVGLVELPDHDRIRLVGFLQGFTTEPHIADRVDFKFAHFDADLTRLYFGPWCSDGD
jgi:uncharacterized OB-fold protein